MKKIWIFAVLIVLIGGLAVWWFMLRDSDSTPAEEATTETTESETTEADETEAEAPGIVTVSFTDDGWSPRTVGPIPVGTTVRFINQSSSNFQPASNPHPLHTDLEGFDAGREIPPGGSYSFVFNEVGEWGFHDHPNEDQTGTIIVESAL